MTTSFARWPFERWLMALTMACVAVAARADGEQRLLRWRLVMPPPVSAASASAPALPMVPNGCARTDEEWKTWRESTIRYLLQLHKPTKDECKPGKSGRSGICDPYLNRDEVSNRSSLVVAALDQCAAAKQPAPDAILRNLERFVRGQHNANYLLPNPQHQFGHGGHGLELNDEAYLCNDRVKQALELPCLLKSQEFLGYLSRPQDYGKAHELIQKQNRGEPLGNRCEPDGTQWDTLFYRSRMLTTPDEAEALGRFLVVVPAQDKDKLTGYDRWIQFGIWAPGRKGGKVPDKLQNVSVVAVSRVPEPAKGQELPAGSFDAMADWYRCTDTTCGPAARASDGATLARNACMDEPDRDAKVQLKYRLAVSGQSEDCQRCHKHMPVGIHTDKVFVPTKAGHLEALKPAAAASAVAAINDKIYREDSYQRLARFMLNPDDKMANWRNSGEFGFGTSPENFVDANGNAVGSGRRDSDSVKACAAPAILTVDQVKRIKSAMQCDSCHHARPYPEPKFGVLNYPLATDLRWPTAFNNMSKLAPNIIRSHILRGVMPLEVDGAAADGVLKPTILDKVGKVDKVLREVLYRCLSREYFDPSDPAGPSGLFVDWLRKDPVPATLLKVTAKPVAALSSPAALASKPMAAAHAATPASAAPPAPVPTPESLYRVNCGKCHFPTAKGPKLSGILGRTLAGDSNYGDYSTGLKLLGGKGEKWTNDLLMEFLENPNKFVDQKAGTTDGSEMKKVFPDEDIRRAIIKHLSKL